MSSTAVANSVPNNEGFMRTTVTHPLSILPSPHIDCPPAVWNTAPPAPTRGGSGFAPYTEGCLSTGQFHPQTIIWKSRGWTPDYVGGHTVYHRREITRHFRIDCAIHKSAGFLVPALPHGLLYVVPVKNSGRVIPFRSYR